MRMIGKPAVTLSLLLAATLTGTALADDAKPAAPAAPALADVLTASGITATGYVDGTYSYLSVSPPTGSSVDSNTFALNQASLSLAYTPATGFGALVNAVAGTEAGNGCYAPGYLTGPPPLGPCATGGSTSSFNLLQAYAQYISGKTTVYLGKFTTLAGAEVAAPTGDTNITRSLLFWYSEPVTHVGARVTYAASATANFTVGVNNGWNVDTSTGSGKTLELAFGLTPSKAFALTGAGYYGDVDRANGLTTRTLLDLVATWTVSPKLTIIANADWDNQKITPGTYLVDGDAKWWGAALYGNFAISDTWRTSLRLEYLDDQDGFATTGANQGAAVKVNEGTLTFGYAPSKNFEFRFEGRYDTYKPDGSDSAKATQAWLQALYKF